VIIPAVPEDTSRVHLNAQLDTDTDLLLAELHVLDTLPLVVVRLSETQAETWGIDCYRKENNYIVIMKDSSGCEMREVMATLTSYIASLAVLPTWNSRALFVVAIMTKDCGSNAKKVAQSILEELWKWRIVKVTVVLPTSEPYHVQEVSHKHKKSAPPLHIFVFFPHKQPHNCTNFQSLFTMQQCPVNPHFLHNSAPFVPTFPSNLEGCPIAVSTFVYEPFVFGPVTVTTDNNSTVLRYKDGFEIKLLNLISKEINASVVFLPPPPKVEMWGRHFENGTWTGIKGNVIHGRADLCLCATVTTEDAAALMDPTVTYFRGGFVWVVPYPARFPRWLSVFRVFTSLAWLQMIVTIVFVSFVLWCLPRIPINQVDATRTISANICDACAVVLGVSIPQMPRSVYIRIFFIFWVAYSLAINTVYQAFLTSFLTDPGFVTPIRDLDELLDSGIEYGYLRFVDRYLDTSNIKHRQILTGRKECFNSTACLERVALERDLAQCVSRQVLDYAVFNTFRDASGVPLIYPFADDFVQYNVVMYLQKGSPLLDAFNHIIVHAMQAGLLDKWYNDDIYISKLRAHKASRNNKDNGYSILSNTHLQGAFVLYGIGNVLGLLLLLLEIAYHYLIAVSTCNRNFLQPRKLLVCRGG
jgi:hypothetical protein